MTKDDTHTVDRRDVLRGITVSGGTALLGATPAAATVSEVGRVQFAELGVEHSFDASADAVDHLAVDSPPKYTVDGDDVVFFDEHLSATEQGRIDGRGPLVAGSALESVPATGVARGETEVVVTETRPDLAPESGFLAAGPYRPPEAGVRQTGDSLEFSAGSETVTVAPGEERRVELQSRPVRAQRLERVDESGDGPNESGDSGVVYEEVTEQVEVTPTLVVRNHGELTAKRVAARTEGE